MYDQYVQLLNEKYPFILVEGANYEPSWFYMVLVKIIVSFAYFNLKKKKFNFFFEHTFEVMIVLGVFYSQGTLKMVAIMCVLGGVDVFTYLNQPQPSWWRWCTENKIYACMMLFFLSNMLEGQLLSSGAFEIVFNNVPIWSKLESGRIPQPAELFQIIDSHMQFTDTKLELNGFAK